MTDIDPEIRKLMTQLGAHFYENSEEFIMQLLQYSGFKVKELKARPEGGFHFKAEKTTIEGTP